MSGPRHAQWDQVKVHDYFNLVALSFLNICNAHYLYTGAGFPFFWTASMCYFLLDILYVGMYPGSIKSPVVILSHHVVTSLAMLVPYSYPEYEPMMGWCMLVEFNTLMLIARRNFHSKVLDALFYVSWVVLRNIWYPYLVFVMYGKWQDETKRCGTMWNPIIVAPIFQLFFTGLNYMWTCTLVYRVLKPAAGGKGRVTMAQLQQSDTKKHCLQQAPEEKQAKWL